MRLEAARAAAVENEEVAGEEIPGFDRRSPSSSHGRRWHRDSPSAPPNRPAPPRDTTGESSTASAPTPPRRPARLQARKYLAGAAIKDLWLHHAGSIFQAVSEKSRELPCLIDHSHRGKIDSPEPPAKSLRACLRISFCNKRAAESLNESLQYGSSPHSMRRYAHSPCCASGIAQASRTSARQSNAWAAPQTL